MLHWRKIAKSWTPILIWHFDLFLRAAEEEDVTLLENGVDGIFSGKTFVILGFPLEQEEQILEMTVGQGGMVLAMPLCVFFPIEFG